MKKKLLKLDTIQNIYKLFFLASILLFFSCKKEIPDTPADVYIAGTELYDNSGAHFRAVYWKNSNINFLSDGTKDAFATDIQVVDNDIYICGYELNGLSSNAVYWKNGVPTYLTNYIDDSTKSSTATSIKIIGNDIYIGGTDRQNARTTKRATYWKNRVPTTISDVQADLKDMDVSNNNVHTVIQNEVKFLNPFDDYNYWINTTGYYRGPDSSASTLNSVKINNNDVYIAGEDGNYPIYAKNGSFTLLSTFGNGTGAVDDIFINGTDEYFAGVLNDQATYWKNGEKKTNHIESFSRNTGIFVLETDVHTAGFCISNTGKYNAIYILNGSFSYLHNLQAYYSVANAIYVVKK
ncbi:MAG: hypothetical protein K1X55_04470 [Chitinophagales bacterium]|nr:hypothetical protein [Chitinophagales bacterium]